MNSSEPLHELGQGLYRVKLSDAGSGASRWDWIALNRWSDDLLEDAQGLLVYLRDLDSGALWSAGRQPVRCAPQRYEVRREGAGFTIERSDHGIDTRMSVSVVDADQLEVRELQLHNRRAQACRIEVTSCLEVALAHPAGDLAHPAFSKLFVQTSRLDDCAVLIAKRRPRGAGEHWPLLFHALAGAPVQAWETDRLRFVGRGRSLASPAMAMAGTLGNVLDPVLSLRTVLELAPGERRSLRLLLGAAAEPAQLSERVQRHAADARWAPTLLLDQPPAAVAVDAGFSDDGSEYRIRLNPQQGQPRPPMPWINVIANPHFGCIVSETGAGCTWSRNSQANRLTPWSNDPVSDPHDEAWYLRDEDSGQVWSPLPGPAPAAAPYETAHGFGYSRFDSRCNDLEQRATVFVAREDPVKLLRLRLTNHGSEPRRLSLFAYQRLVLGSLPPAIGAIRSWQQGSLLCATNERAGDFAGGIAFSLVASTHAYDEHISCDRRSFIGEHRSASAPLALEQPALDGRCGDGLDPCFARQLRFTLQPGVAAEFCFVLGEAVGDAQLQALADRYAQADAAAQALDEVRRFWQDGLGGLSVQTPYPEINAMVNGWMPYQALSCRIWGRAALYQSGGAYGFRDQLQDAGNLSLLWPQLAREQILLHARHQFVEGDVLHWWHPEPMERGLRTRFADDLLWLPYYTLDHLRATGDSALLDESLSFLQGPPLDAGEDERYIQPAASGQTASLYEHCCRALDRSLAVGSHGLPLMGTGDWNDGMNRVGREGRGESVWMAFFLYSMLDGFGDLAEQRGDTDRAVRYRQHRQALRVAANDAGWDGAWYRRAYYDDGTPLGTAGASECRIDALVQAWAVLSGAAPAERATAAMDAAESQLIDEADKLIRLLTPPFVDTPQDPGYIKGYVAGVRENGGQYTHAACWTVAALAKLGRRERAAQLLAMLSPLKHTDGGDAQQRYKVEPYVIAADVYGAEPHIGRGGWTWYTGSAGWAWRVAVESVLGLRIEGGDTLVLQPCIPDHWPGYRLEYREPHSGTHYRIDVRNPDGCTQSVVGIELDGKPHPVSSGIARLPLLQDGGEHRVEVLLGRGDAG